MICGLKQTSRVGTLRKTQLGDGFGSFGICKHPKKNHEESLCCPQTKIIERWFLGALASANIQTTLASQTSRPVPPAAHGAELGCGAIPLQGPRTARSSQPISVSVHGAFLDPEDQVGGEHYPPGPRKPGACLCRFKWRGQFSSCSWIGRNNESTKPRNPTSSGFT